jgi:nitrite reductase/ring-hydroxylating ferredoxin subunit
MLTATGLKRSELGTDGRKLVRHEGKQVLVIAQEGSVFAIANRCPHEGYPLSEGTIGPGCVLTCNWHNWKFDLTSGAALVGRDPVRTYEVVEHGGEIFIDFRDPPAEECRARALRGIEAAILDNDRPRMAREAARLERAGCDAREALVHAFQLCSERLEDGMTHAHAAAADWLLLADRAETPVERLAAELEPVAHIAWEPRGRAHFPTRKPPRNGTEPASPRRSRRRASRPRSRISAVPWRKASPMRHCVPLLAMRRSRTTPISVIAQSTR